MSGEGNLNPSSPCVYFRPIPYYFDSNQAGYPYKNILDTHTSLAKWPMWGKQVSTFRILPYRSGGKPSPPAKWLQADEGITSVSSILLPKVASRSIETLFYETLSIPVGERRRQLGPRIGIATPFFWQQVARRQLQQQEHAAAAAATNNAMDSARTSDVVFSILRDPPSRFLSALAQTLSRPMLLRDRECQELWQPCLDTSSSYRELVKCAIRSMKQRQSMADYSSSLSPYFDVHLFPQAFFLTHVLDKQDVEIRLFPMKALDMLLHAFSGHDTNTQRRNTREEKLYSPDIQSRFGTELTDPNNAWEAIMEDSTILNDICNLYDIDVALMHHLGFSAGECD